MSSQIRIFNTLLRFANMNRTYMNDFIDQKADGHRKKFAQDADISYTALLNFLNSDDSDKSLSTSTLKRIVNKYPDFDIRMFINEGSDADPGFDPQNQKQVIPAEYTNKAIYYVPIRARAGYLHSYDDELFLQSLQKVVLPSFEGEPTNKRIFQVEGDSMYRTLVNDDLVIAQKVERTDPIIEDYIYVVVTRSEGMLIKRVSDRVKERNVLVLRSDNYKAGYSPIVVPVEDVVELWLAKGKITYDLGRDHTLEDEIAEMKNEVAILRSEIHKLL